MLSTSASTMAQPPDKPCLSSTFTSFRDTPATFQTLAVASATSSRQRRATGNMSDGVHTSDSEQVLVAVLNNPADLKAAREAHWYRIPIPSVEKWLARRWPPQWL